MPAIAVATGGKVSIGTTIVSTLVVGQPDAGDAETIYVPGLEMVSCELSLLVPLIVPPFRVFQV
jgi:GTPase